MFGLGVGPTCHETHCHMSPATACSSELQSTSSLDQVSPSCRYQTITHPLRFDRHQLTSLRHHPPQIPEQWQTEYLPRVSGVSLPSSNGKHFQVAGLCHRRASQGLRVFFHIFARLEAATSRLEDIAIAQTSAGSSAAVADHVSGCNSPAVTATAASGSATPAHTLESPPSIKAYDELISGSLDKYLSIAKEVGGPAQEQATHVQRAFSAQREFLLVASACQKPSMASLMELLQPTSEPLNKSVEVKDAYRGEKRLFNGLTAVAEGIPGLGWVAAESKPGPMVADAKDSAQFWVNRVVKDYKDRFVYTCDH